MCMANGNADNNEAKNSNVFANVQFSELVDEGDTALGQLPDVIGGTSK